MEFFRKFIHDRRGAEMVEYILLVAFIALAFAGSYPIYQKALSKYYNRIANTIAQKSP